MWPALAVALSLTCPARVRQEPAPVTPPPRQANELTAAGAQRVMRRMLWAFGVVDWRSAPLPELGSDLPYPAYPYREYSASVPATANHDGWKLSIDSVSGALDRYELILQAGTAASASPKALTTTAELRERALKIAALAPLPPGYTLRTTDWFPRKVTIEVDGMPDVLEYTSHEPSSEAKTCKAWFAPDLPGRYPIDRWSTGYRPTAVLAFDVRSGRLTAAAALTHVIVVPRQVRVSGAAARRVADRYAAPFLQRNPDALRFVPRGHDPCTKVALEYARLRGRVLDEEGLSTGADISPVGLQTIQLVWTVQYGQLEVWIDPTTGEEVGVNH